MKRMSHVLHYFDSKLNMLLFYVGNSKSMKWKVTDMMPEYKYDCSGINFNFK